jgi:cation/acetate symporter
VVYCVIIGFYAWYMNKLDIEHGCRREEDDHGWHEFRNGARRHVQRRGSQRAFKKQLNKVYKPGTPAAFSSSWSCWPSSSRWAAARMDRLHLPARHHRLLYAGIGIMSRTTDAAEYYVAGRRVPAVYNGMATGADWMSAASFIGMAGTLYLTGYGGLAFIMGWTGGYCLVALFLAPYLRKFGQFTIPDFLGERYEGNLPRFIGI